MLDGELQEIIFSHLGYSNALEASDATPRNQKLCAWLRSLFGEFVTIQFHVSDIAPGRRAIKVMGRSSPGNPPIDEHFAGRDKSRQKTKNGSLFVLNIRSGMTVMEEYDPPLDAP